MSFQWMDNFLPWGTVARMLEGTPWLHLITSSGSNLVADPDPNAAAGSMCLRVSGGSNSGSTNLARIALTDPHTKAGVAFRLWMPSLGEAASVHFRSTANAALYRLVVGANGSLSIRRITGSGAGAEVVVFDSVAPLLFGGAWTHFEWIWDRTTNDFEVYREGLPVAALTGVDADGPVSGNIGIIGFAQSQPGGGGEGVGVARIKDLFIYNGAGSHVNSQVGPVSVTMHPVDSDVSSGWTRSSGTSDYELLDETVADDAGYISAPDTLPAPSIMGFTNLNPDVVAVRAINLVYRGRKTDGGDASVQTAFLSGVSTDSGTNRAISTAYTYYWDVSELDPATAAPWTPSAVDAATLSINRTV